MHPHQISSLIALDALVRRLRQLGETGVHWELSTLAGDAAVQRAVERVVVREGEDRETLGREGFSERARRLEQDAESDLRVLLARLSIETDLDRWGVHGDAASKAARIAFVRLYEAGVLARETTVVDACPSCATVIDEADTNVAELDVESLHIALSLPEGQINLECSQPELFVGAVAVAVPEAFETSEKSVFFPIANAELPIVKVAGIDSPRAVVPAHDRWSFELARVHDFEILDVLDAEGVVRRGGPLEGLGRFAARATAAELLANEGFVVARFETKEEVRRCHRCSTQVVPMYGVHWVLSFDTLVPPLRQVLESGVVNFSPSTALDRLLSIAENADSWCISQQLWSGETIPVATCLDCGQTSVSVDDQESCGACMGTLQPHLDILDARFIAAIVPLAMLGWPDEIADPDGALVTMSVGRTGLETWALPIASLGLRLAGCVPFDQLTVHQLTVGSDPGQQPTPSLVELVERAGTATARAALLLGDLETQRAHELLNDLANPVQGEAHVQDLVEPYDSALQSLDAGGALLALQVAAKDGLDESSRREIASLVEPLLAQ